MKIALFCLAVVLPSVLSYTITLPEGCQLQFDVAVILDSSISKQNFDIVKEFAAATALPRDLDNMGTAFIQTGGTPPPTLSVPLDNNYNGEELSEVLQNMVYRPDLSGDKSHDGRKALEMVRDQVFGHDGDRAELFNSVIYVAGSKSNTPLKEIMDELRAEGVKVNVVAVNLDDEAKEQMAGDCGDESIFYFDKYELPTEETVTKLTQWLCVREAAFFEEMEAMDMLETDMDMGDEENMMVDDTMPQESAPMMPPVKPGLKGDMADEDMSDSVYMEDRYLKRTLAGAPGAPGTPPPGRR